MTKSLKANSNPFQILCSQLQGPCGWQLWHSAVCLGGPLLLLQHTWGQAIDCNQMKTVCEGFWVLFEGMHTTHSCYVPTTVLHLCRQNLHLSYFELCNSK